MLSLIILAGLLLGGLLLGALLLWMGGKLVGIPRATFFRSFLATLLIAVLNAGLLFGFSLWQPAAAPGQLAKAGLELLLGLACCWAVLAFSWRASLLWTMLASLPWLVVGTLYGVAVVLLVPPFLLAAYIMPNNSMAPSLPGPHFRARCPDCERDVLVPAYPDDPPSRERQQTEGQIAICSGCLKVRHLHEWPPHMHAPTRFLCNKLLSPRRWDLVVFRNPRNPDNVYVKRVVGLPGEEVTIKNSAVWIDGQKMTPPDPGP